MMVCATSSTIRNPAPPRPLLLSMAITAASRPARRRSAPTSVVALDRQKARLGYAGNTHRQPTQPDRGPARRLIWPAKPGQLRENKSTNWAPRSRRSLSNYLTAAPVDATLRWIGSLAEGSRLIFTYVDADVLGGSDRF